MCVLYFAPILNDVVSLDLVVSACPNTCYSLHLLITEVAKLSLNPQIRICLTQLSDHNPELRKSLGKFIFNANKYRFVAPACLDVPNN